MHKTISVINPQEKLDHITQHWSPKIVAQLNDYHIKLAKVNGTFVWHKHDNTDELFILISGNLKIELRDKVLELKPGQLVVIPKGIEHRPIAQFEAAIMLIEPKDTLNTGDAKDTEDKVPSCGQWI